ncbi:MAG: hypothetical protein AB7G21_06480 [Dehalococcoidia bacterium]
METAQRLPRFFVAWSAAPWVLGQVVFALTVYIAIRWTPGDNEVIGVLVGMLVLFLGVPGAALLTGFLHGIVLRWAGIAVSLSGWTFATLGGILAGYVAVLFASLPALVLLRVIEEPARAGLRGDVTSGLLAVATLGSVFLLWGICAGAAFGAALGGVQGTVLGAAGIAGAGSWWWRMGLVWTATVFTLAAVPFLSGGLSVIGMVVLPGQVAGLLTAVAMRRMPASEPAPPPAPVPPEATEPTEHLAPLAVTAVPATDSDDGRIVGEFREV